MQYTTIIMWIFGVILTFAIFGAVAADPTAACIATGAPAIAEGSSLGSLSSVNVKLIASSDLEGMPAVKVAEYLESGFSFRTICSPDTAALFMALSTSKIARVLAEIKNGELRSLLFSAIAATDRGRALKILSFSKEQPFDSKPDGSNAFQLLSGLAEKAKADLKKAMAKTDPRYLEAIERVTNSGRNAVGVHLEKVPAAAVLKRPAMNDDPGIPAVAQREYLITTAATHPRIETSGLGPCVAFTLYDPQTKTGLLAHVDAPTHAYDSFDRALLEFEKRGIDPTRLQARVIGGEDDERYKISPRTAYEIIRRLNEAGVSIVERDILGKGGRSIIFDLTDGRAYDLQHGVYKPNTPKEDRLWDTSHKKFCDGYFYRHEASLPSVEVSTEQYEQARQCY